MTLPTPSRLRWGSGNPTYASPWVLGLYVHRLSCPSNKLLPLACSGQQVLRPRDSRPGPSLCSAPTSPSTLSVSPQKPQQLLAPHTFQSFTSLGLYSRYNIVLNTVSHRANTSITSCVPGTVLVHIYSKISLNIPMCRCYSHPHFIDGHTEPTQGKRLVAAGQVSAPSVSEDCPGRKSLVPWPTPFRKRRVGSFINQASSLGGKQAQEKS